VTAYAEATNGNSRSFGRRVALGMATREDGAEGYLVSNPKFRNAPPPYYLIANVGKQNECQGATRGWVRSHGRMILEVLRHNLLSR